ncbi:MAG: hypothetical protein LQ343_006459 [Gyalolechia ehrenbergii]|nr:MAG: hypothetical protein LQ343_006459 [Gyalolechia ehrenbergii]
MDGEQFSTKESNTLLNKDPFRNEDTQRLFEAIDELRGCGANHEIELPELVIVGDQSAGKSSLLQSLTDIPFPVDERLCTRFPTRIVSRRTPNEGETTKISIEPSSGISQLEAFGLNLDATPQERSKRLEAYSKFAYSSSNMSTDDFRDAIRDAKRLMGLTEDESPEEGMRTVGGRHFASDVLKVEISGPNRSHFSILDVPGIFHSLTKELTKVEMDGVREMVAFYMKPQQSIIICVASGPYELANQAAFDMASKYDPQLQRTIGVITKCDVTQDKKRVLSLAQNKEKTLSHGWFVVRNRTPEELEDNISNIERQKREENFFDAKPWNTLSESRRGTQALKNHLADLLCHRIQEVFPSIYATIQERQASSRHQLERLGPSRTTTEERRTYLTDLAQQLHSLNSQALRGRYHGLPNESLRLRRLVREANDTFTTEMIDHGHCVPFEDTPIYRNDTLINQDAKDGKRSAKEHFGSANPSTTMNGGNLDGFNSYSDPNRKAVIESSESAGKKSNEPSLPAGTSRGGGGGLFGNQAGNSTSDGAPSTASLGKGLFGSSASDATPTSTGPGFGAKSSIFGNFNEKSAFGSKGGFGGFGQTSTTPLFGSQLTAKSNSLPIDEHRPNGFSQPSENVAPAPQIISSPAPNSLLAINGSASVGFPPSQIYTWIKEEIKNCRGTELQGTLNPDVLPALFHRQIAGWKVIAATHFQSVAKVTIETLERAVVATCGNEFTAQQILTLIRRTNKTSEEHGLFQIQERFKEITSRHLQTQNPIFEKNIRNARLARFKAALKRYHESHTASFVGFSKPETNEIVLNLSDVTSLFDELHMSNTQNLEDEIHDTLKSYYELALHDFIEFVTQQVVESYLNDPKGPVLFFNPLHIGSMTLEEIEDFGAEDPATAKARLEKEETLTRLERAEKIALKYMKASR